MTHIRQMHVDVFGYKIWNIRNLDDTHFYRELYYFGRQVNYTTMYSGAMPSLYTMSEYYDMIFKQL